MTTLLLPLGFLLAAGVLVVIVLWRFHGSLSGGALLLERREVSVPGRPALATYAPMNRLFAEGDFTLLARQNRPQPGMLRQLRRMRWAILRLYLGELHGDFRRVYTICRALALLSQSPDFSTQVTRQAIRFYGHWIVLHVCCFFSWTYQARVNTSKLVSTLARLDEAARASMLEPAAVRLGG